MQWLRSGLRRDVCVVVCSLGEATGQEVKRALERRYEEHVTPRTFHGALDELVAGGHLEREADGLVDRYALTPASEDALRDHYDWVADCL